MQAWYASGVTQSIQNKAFVQERRVDTMFLVVTTFHEHEWTALTVQWTMGMCRDHIWPDYLPSLNTPLRINRPK